MSEFKRRQSLDLKEGILQFLQLTCRGRTRPIRAQDLAYKFEVNIREINDAIRSLRLDGILIGSSKEKPFGYYLPATEEEVKIYLNTYKSELFDMLDVYNRQKRARRLFLDNLKTRDFFSIRNTDSGQFEMVLTEAR